MIIKVAAGLTIAAATTLFLYFLNTPTQDLYYPESKAFKKDD